MLSACSLAGLHLPPAVASIHALTAAACGLLRRTRGRARLQAEAEQQHVCVSAEGWPEWKVTITAYAQVQTLDARPFRCSQTKLLQQ